MRAELEQVKFRQLRSPEGTPPRYQLWEMLAPDGTGPFARVEIFPGEAYWGIHLHDQAPALDASDLLRLTARLLVWEVSCPAETVQVLTSRSREPQTLVRVGADYV
ncbi:MAG: hypothetical protein AAGF12_35515 [Myxococcota bacterium]